MNSASLAVGQQHPEIRIARQVGPSTERLDVTVRQRVVSSTFPQNCGRTYLQEEAAVRFGTKDYRPLISTPVHTDSEQIAKLVLVQLQGMALGGRLCGKPAQSGRGCLHKGIAGLLDDTSPPSPLPLLAMSP